MAGLIMYFIILVAVVFIMLLLIYFLNLHTSDYEKHAAYECGFEPFSDARGFFDVHFYVIGLLFVIFDLEIVFLIPFVVNIEYTQILEYVGFILFLIIVLVGFMYEWSIGLLNWVPAHFY